MHPSSRAPGWVRNGVAVAVTALVLVMCAVILLRANDVAAGDESDASEDGSSAPTSPAAPLTPVDPAATGVPEEPMAPEIGDRPGGRAPVVGVQFHGIWDDVTRRDRAATLDRIVEMGATWVRVDFSWAALEPEGPDSFGTSYGTGIADQTISMAHRRGLKVLGMLWLSPEWAQPAAGERSAPADHGDYARALARAADRWQGKVQAWQVWNEPNLDIFFAGADPAVYSQLLCTAYDAVREGGSGARVVFGATVHNDVDWVRRAYDAGVQGCFDVMAAHPYGAPSDAPPSTGSTDMWQLGAIANIHELMVSRGDRSPLWATELGWSTHPNTGVEENHVRGVTEQQQADYTIEALEIFRRDHPYVRQVFVYDAVDKETGDPHQNAFGILHEDFSPKPVFWALQEWIDAT